jgi:predicted metal-binding protein
LESELNAYPETFRCIHCGEVVEIWSDEKRGKCPTCAKMVSKQFLNECHEPGDELRCRVEVKEFQGETGETLYYERYEVFVPISAFEHDRKYKTACEACHKFGKNFACPPYSPSFSDYLAAQEYAKVICVRMPHADQGAIDREPFRRARTILVDELMTFRKRGLLVGGSGFCLGCERCQVEDGGERCIKPNVMIYSLESLGVNLTSLTKTCFDLDLEWSDSTKTADFVCSIGAVFFPRNGLAG